MEKDRIKTRSILARLGRAGVKTVRFDTGTGGTPEYISTDYAWLLKGLSREATAWIVYAYSNTTDPTSFNFLAARLSKVLIRKYEIRPGVAVRLVKHVMQEQMLPPCRYCNGAGCDKCETGRQPVSMRLMASICGVPKTTFSRNYSNYKKMMTFVEMLIDKWERSAAELIKSKMP